LIIKTNYKSSYLNKLLDELLDELLVELLDERRHKLKFEFEPVGNFKLVSGLADQLSNKF